MEHFRIGDVTIQRVVKTKELEDDERGDTSEQGSEHGSEEQGSDHCSEQGLEDQEAPLEEEPQPNEEEDRPELDEDPNNDGSGGEEDVARVSLMESEDLLKEVKEEPRSDDEREEDDRGESLLGGEPPPVKEEPEETDMPNQDEEGEDEVVDGDDSNSSLKRKSDSTGDDHINKKKKSGVSDDSDDGEKGNAERKVANLRRNIREVMDETQLDEATLSAQRQEMERLRRVQDQQKYLREVQKQITVSRVQNKTQTKVLSLLSGSSSGSSLLKSNSNAAAKPSTVLVKLSSNGGPPQVLNNKTLEVLRGGTSQELKSNVCRLPSTKSGMVTPSVSIAPVKPASATPKSKDSDVVEISSSSDEDDCIVISEPSEDESADDEDTGNSGMHTNDVYNCADEQGRVLINVGKPEHEPDVFLAPQIARIIKPHQIGGVRFMFDNVVESIERYKSSSGFGCILAHSMGLGKTLQVISFCDVFLRDTGARSVMCIMPINTLQNWMAEFNMWLPQDPANCPLSQQGEVRPRNFSLFVLNDLHKTLTARAKVVQDWTREGGVLLIGYEMYRQLSMRKNIKPRKGKKKVPEQDLDDDKVKPLLDEVYEALVKPGPDLVICDEGHRIKNSHASISAALKQIRTKRRIVLTGYPLQNNLLEYWCMVDFVRPNYLGTKAEFSNMFERPIQNGQCIDSTPQDIRLMRYRAHVLHSLLEGFVQRRSHDVLRTSLPQKEEYVLLVRMTPFQRKLYDRFMNDVVRTKAVPNPLKAFAVCCKIWNHPDILYNFLKKREMDELQDLDIDEGVLGETKKDKKGKSKKGQAAANQGKTEIPSFGNSFIKNENKDGQMGGNYGNNQFQYPYNYPGGYSGQQGQQQGGSGYGQYNNQFNQPYQEGNWNQGNYPGAQFSNNQPPPYYQGNYFNSPVKQENEWMNQGYFPDKSKEEPPRDPEFFNQAKQEPKKTPSKKGRKAKAKQEVQKQTFSHGFSGGQVVYNYTEQNRDQYQEQNFQNQKFPYNQNQFGPGFQFPNQFPDVKPQMDDERQKPADTQNFNQFDSNQFNQGQFNNDYDMNKYPNYPREGQFNNQMFNPTFPNPQINNNPFPQDKTQFQFNQKGQFEDPMKNQYDNNFPINQVNQMPPFEQKEFPGNQAIQEPFNQDRAREGQVKNQFQSQEQNQFNPPQDQINPMPEKNIPSQFDQKSMATQFDQKNMSTQFDQKNMGAQFDQKNMATQFDQKNMATQFDQKTMASQFEQKNMATQFDQKNMGTQFDQKNMSTQFDQKNQFNNQPFDPRSSEAFFDKQFTEGKNFSFGDNQNIDQIKNHLSGLGGQNQPDIEKPQLFNQKNQEQSQQPYFDQTGFNQQNQKANFEMSQSNTMVPPITSTASGNQMPSSSYSSNYNNQQFDQKGQFIQQNDSKSTLYPNQSFEQKNQFYDSKNYAAPNQFEQKNPDSKEQRETKSDFNFEQKTDIHGDQFDQKNQMFSQFNFPQNMEQRQFNENQPNQNFYNQTCNPDFSSFKNQFPPGESNSQSRFNMSDNFGNQPHFPNEQNQYGNLSFEDMFPKSSQGKETPKKSSKNQTDKKTFSQNFNQNFDMKSPPSQNQEKDKKFNPNQNFDFHPMGGQFGGNNFQGGQMQGQMNFNPDPFKSPPATQSYPAKDQNMLQQSAQNSYPNQYQQKGQYNFNNPPPIDQMGKQNDNFQNDQKNFMPVQNFPNTNYSEERNNRYMQNYGPNFTPRDESHYPATSEFQGANQYPTTSTGQMNQFPGNQLPQQFSNQDYPFSDGQNTKGPDMKEQTEDTSCQTEPIVRPTRHPTERLLADEINKHSEDPDGTKDDKKDEKKPENVPKSGKEEPGIPYDWAIELMKGYVPGKIDESAKMMIFFCILEESIALGDRILVFSQSLFTLNLMEELLQQQLVPGRPERWMRNVNYYRLDGSTSASEREKLINEFNSNPNFQMFLVSTRAGSLGINLVGANRVIVFDASWNPCHDTQAVCRVYRYGQKKPCFVYRLVTDNCLEKKIYDRQINKQGMSDRVVDECNPEAHLSIKEVTSLCWDDKEDSTSPIDVPATKDRYIDVVIQKVIEKHAPVLTKEPFHHESLLVERKDKKLSQAEKRLAKRSYELEKQANSNCNRPVYTNQSTVQTRGGVKPMASVRPMQSEQLVKDGKPQARGWIPAAVWQRQGMSAQEMTLPLDVVIPTNAPDKASIVLKSGQKVMVLKSPKGIYMQLETGKIIAIRTAVKMGGVKDKKSPDAKLSDPKKDLMGRPRGTVLPNLRNNSVSILPRSSVGSNVRSGIRPVRVLSKPGVQGKTVATARPYVREPEITMTPVKKKITLPGTSSVSISQVSSEEFQGEERRGEEESTENEEENDNRETEERSSEDEVARIEPQKPVEALRPLSEMESHSDSRPMELTRPIMPDMSPISANDKRIPDGGHLLENRHMEALRQMESRHVDTARPVESRPEFNREYRTERSDGPLEIRAVERAVDRPKELTITKPVEPARPIERHTDVPRPDMSKTADSSTPDDSARLLQDLPMDQRTFPMLDSNRPADSRHIFEGRPDSRAIFDSSRPIDASRPIEPSRPSEARGAETKPVARPEPIRHLSEERKPEVLVRPSEAFAPYQKEDPNYKPGYPATQYYQPYPPYPPPPTVYPSAFHRPEPSTSFNYPPYNPFPFAPPQYHPPPQ